MLLTWSRYSALLFAIGLGIGEAVINWGHWQYAPLWIIDYLVVTWLAFGFLKTRAGQNIHILMSGWAFTAGVFYMALFVSLDPELARHINADTTLLVLMGLMLLLSSIGFICALSAHYRQN